jgi:hypothetical protein
VTIHPVEATWLAITIVTLAITLYALREALISRRVVTQLNGKAREINAQSVVRRERFRVLIQCWLIGIAIPPALRPGDVPFTISVALLMVLPVILLASSMLDLRDHRRILGMHTDAIEAERIASAERIESWGQHLAAAVTENTALTQETHDVVVELADRDPGREP